MDGGGPKDSRERLYARASSRASTASTTNTQMTPKSANSSSSHLRETTHTNSHPTHKYHHGHCSKGSTGARPMSRLSREPSDELRKSTTMVSSFLQERLQQERNERQASKLGNDMSASTGDIRERDVQDSPVRRSTTAMGRRQRLDGGDEPTKDSGMGARQMEQTLSTLHKQNFDLKLELYHRREKQTALEERVEKLESHQHEMMDLHDSIMKELETKDNALEEAITLIMELETRVDELVQERNMVRQVEADGSYRHSSSDEPPSVSAIPATPKPTSLFVPRSTGDGKSLGRVPSFLSEYSQQTENLRNVVLKGRSSVMHLRKASGSSVDQGIDSTEINRIASPSLSVLSESSFVSIYGAKDDRDKTDHQPSDDIAGMDGSYTDRSATPSRKLAMESRGSRRSSTPNHISTTPGGGARLSTNMQSLNNILDMDSPLQKIERLDGRITVADNTSEYPAVDRGRGAATPIPGKAPMNYPQQSKSKQEKREALQKVLTNYPTHRDFSNPQAFPPTPDTVSSSTLRKHQNLTSSQDSLSKQAGNVPGEGLMPIYDRIGNSIREQGYQASSSQHAPVAAFSGRRHVPMPPINTDLVSDLGQLARSLPRRPHSATETTSSRARANSVGSDSDSDGGADARSEADSFDYWMRESMKPNRYQADTSGQRRNGRSTSPDLFSFPADAGGWETDVIFGALKGSGYLGSPVSALKRDPLDEMASSLQTSQADVFDPPMTSQAPPTPDRRSSLHARTGSSNAVPPSGGRLRKSLAKGPGMGWVDGRGRSNSIDSAAQASSSKMQPQQLETTPGKKNHYPPISGQANKGRSLGLNSFFKRSGSESFSVPSSATEATFPVPTPAQLSALPPSMTVGRLSGRSSVPPPATMPWRPPGVADDDLTSATPPPIMRSRGQSLLAKTGSVEIPEPGTPQQQATDGVTPTTPTTAIPAQGGNGNTTPGGAQSAGRRKWLGFGRMGNAKK
ncbi:uncharacterized protein F4822DRAFT_236490 [Hypoxylon trugodes]|uniref:uncharacterized protein n=1 Tax=Hypoxylon trugodes TaxID=326681 RepID=UPI002196CF6F|nr:uncharacterized protein F4822DRAFT_236490 [Hypoxylon trugodes]KAI1388165.1 hypothetical protein F4822DRAFT_236490 [Hypoxylon trugodes]